MQSNAPYMVGHSMGVPSPNNKGSIKVIQLQSQTPGLRNINFKNLPPLLLEGAGHAKTSLSKYA